ncbi:MAG: DUF362 domain-containing protein [Armatimonadota bacterium]
MTRKQFLTVSLRATTRTTAAEGDRVVVVRFDPPGSWRSDSTALNRALSAAAAALHPAGSEAFWRDVFRPTDTVGLKANCVAKALSTHAEVVSGVVRALDSAGVARDRVIVFDRSVTELRSHGRYRPGSRSDGVRYWGCREAPLQPRYVSMTAGDVQFGVSAIVATACTALVNLPVVKHHAMTGLTLSLKNWYGALERPLLCHGFDRTCDPYIALLNGLPAVKSKVRLVVADALVVMCDGGPYGPGVQWECGRLIVGWNPVAVDVVGLRILNDGRRKHGLQALPMPGYLRSAIRGVGGLDPVDTRRLEVVEVAV